MIILGKIIDIKIIVVAIIIVTYIYIYIKDDSWLDDSWAGLYTSSYAFNDILECDGKSFYWSDYFLCYTLMNS